jgi:hypothetical protein
VQKISGKAYVFAPLIFLFCMTLVCTEVFAKMQDFGNKRIVVPQGWNVNQQGDLAFLTPPNTGKGQAVMMVLLPQQKLTNFKTQFEALVKKNQLERTPIKVGQLISARSPDGYDVLRREMIVRGEDGSTMYVFVTAANPGNRFESLSYVANSEALYKQFLPQLDSVVNSIKFIKPSASGSSDQRVAAAPGASAKPAGSASQQIVYVDAASRKDGERNLNPPPPGNNRLNGLYVTQDSGGEIGPGGTLTSSITWRFYYFMPNGYAYQGPREAGMENIVCTAPTVNKYGGALCTTYSADNNLIRIGLQNPTRFRRKGNDLVIGDYTFALVPKANNLRLNGTYSSFTAGASAANSNGISFSQNGQFQSTNFTGVSVDTEGVSVTNNSAGNAEGTYRINGYTLELNYRNGRKASAFFARVAGDEVLRIGTRTYSCD